MFESRFDQASGLRRWFGPTIADLAAVIAASPGPWGRVAALSLAHAMGELGCRVLVRQAQPADVNIDPAAAGRADPERLAPVVHVLLDGIDESDRSPPAREVVGVLVGQAEAADLPRLYAQARDLAERHDVRRFGLVLDPSGGQARRERCRRNLDDALRRFAGARLVEGGCFGDTRACAAAARAGGSVFEFGDAGAAAAAFRRMANGLLARNELLTQRLNG